MNTSFGIESIGVYAGQASIGVEELFAGRGLDPARLGNVEMYSRSVGLPWEDPVTNAVNAARPIVEALTPDQRSRIELVVTTTESGIDFSKSVASYVHRFLELPAQCRVMEAKQACYSATGIIQLACGYLASQASPGALALVIATDLALVDERAGYAEPATGHGAVAVLLGEDPKLLAIDHGAFGCHSYEVLDSARPTPEFDIADVDQSLFSYLDCVSACFDAYCERVTEADIWSTFGYFAMHTPFAGLVRAAHRKLLREKGSGTAQQIAADFDRRVAPSLIYPAQTGNLCSGSVYLALASLADHAAITEPTRIGLFSYGSGCSSEFFSGVLSPTSSSILSPVSEHLHQRQTLNFSEYTKVLPAASENLRPVENRVVSFDEWKPQPHLGGPILVHTGVKSYHRQYDWK